MKMSMKIFFAAYFVVLLTVGIGGFVLVNYASSSVIDSRVESALSSNLYSAKIFLSLSEQNTSGAPHIYEISDQVSKMTDNDGLTTLNICKLYATTGYDEAAFANGLSDSQQGFAFIDCDGAATLQVICRADLSGEAYYVETLSDFSEIFAQREALISCYRITLLVAAFLSGAVLLCFSLYITKPLKKLSQTANQIAGGDYSKRVPAGRRSMRSAEVSRLSRDFNAMAEAVEANIGELKDEIEKREIFVADFTHELKTPMTAIIGYADMLRSYDLDKSERREIADTVYREAKRLEKLSLELLDILVLKNTEITLLPTSASLLFDNLKKSLRFLSEKYSIKIITEAQPAYILCESSLLISLLYNLADNACKASPAGSAVTVIGEVRDKSYLITVSDKGRGISKENLHKITEPFFMEDKSRSRKQGGAGLGLALCKRIAQLHRTELKFYSEPGMGTAVLIELELDGTKDGEADE